MKKVIFKALAIAGTAAAAYVSTKLIKNAFTNTKEDRVKAKELRKEAEELKKNSTITPETSEEEVIEKANDNLEADVKKAEANVISEKVNGEIICAIIVAALLSTASVVALESTQVIKGYPVCKTLCKIVSSIPSDVSISSSEKTKTAQEIYEKARIDKAVFNAAIKKGE